MRRVDLSGNIRAFRLVKKLTCNISIEEGKKFLSCVNSKKCQEAWTKSCLNCKNYKKKALE
jgi:hypothetical protein